MNTESCTAGTLSYVDLELTLATAATANTIQNSCCINCWLVARNGTWPAKYCSIYAFAVIVARQSYRIHIGRQALRR